MDTVAGNGWRKMAYLWIVIEMIVGSYYITMDPLGGELPFHPPNFTL